MSWLQSYEISVPHYEIRNGKYVFALQLQRLRGASGSSSTLSSANSTDEWSDEASSASAPAVATYVTAFQSYSQFRALWKDLLRATKSTITTASPLPHDGRVAFAQRNRQTRPRLWSHHQSSSNQEEAQAMAVDSETPQSPPKAASAPSSGACPCSNSCCPFTRLHWLLKSYPFPPRMVLKRNSQALLEARRHALDQFIIAVREFFTGFPRSFLHSVDSTERCRVLDIFSSFVGFSEELRTMAISRSPLLVAAWKADMLLHRENLQTPTRAMDAAGVPDTVGYFSAAEEALGDGFCDNNNNDTSTGFNNEADESDEDRASDPAPTEFRATVYVPSLQPLSEDAAATQEVDTCFAPMTTSSSSSISSSQHYANEDDENERYSVGHGGAATKYQRGSSVYIDGSRIPRRTQPSLPKLQIRSAKVKTISSFLVDFRDHLLTQFGDTLDEGGATQIAQLDDARQWELALYLASHVGQLYAVQAILARGTDPNAVMRDGTTPLHVASRSGHNEVVSALVANAADVNVTDKLGMTPLLLAINHGDIALVRLLLDSGADVNLNNVRKVSATHVAVACQSLAILRLLLEYDAFVNTANAINGKTPLHIAAETGNYLICELLLNNGANVHQRTDSGCDAYGLAVAHGHVNVAELCRAFHSHSQRLEANREQLQQQQQQLQQPQQQILVITPLRRSILQLTMAASSTAGCSDHQSVKIVAHDGHSYAVL